MSFKDPSILIALVALAIPLAIHLGGRRRAREVVLPTALFADGLRQAARGRLWLRRFGLLALRLAIVFCLVAALAGPQVQHCGVRIADCGVNGNGNDTASQGPAALGASAASPDRPSRDREVAGASAGGEPAARENTRELVLAARPLVAVLVVDAADEEDARIRSADLVAATFAGDMPDEATVARRAAADVDRGAVEAADVIFWVGWRPPARADVLPALAARGSLVWIPADLRPPDPAMADALGLAAATVQKIPDGVTIDPAGYASELLAAFEGGTGGDLGAPVFQGRLAIEAAGATVVRFRDGAPAIVSCAIATSRDGSNVALAFGPAPSWGDLAARAEFVVLTHSLAEAVSPSRDREVAGASAGGEHVARESTRELTLAARRQGIPSVGALAATDIAPWLNLALALALAAEGVLVARQSAGMVPQH